MRRTVFAIHLLLLMIICSTAAAAGPRIVVLPFVTTDEELVIYGKPVADAVARGLAGLGDLSVGDKTGAKADLVVELRVARAKGKVRVEAIVRDAEVGQSQSRVSAKPVALGDLDQAATELARALAKPIGDAVSGRSRRKSDEKAAVKAIPAAAPAPSPSPANQPLRQPDFRPAVLVFQPTGEVAGGFDFRDVTLSTMDRLVAREGGRTILASRTGFVEPDEAAREATAAHAKATVMMRVHDVEFIWTGVLTARGHVHFVVVAPDGKLLMNRDIETDTVVGSRGDLNDALVRFVVAQAFDIARKELVAAIR